LTMKLIPFRFVPPEQNAILDWVFVGLDKVMVCNLPPLPYILVLASFPYYVSQQGCFPAFVFTNV
jgi:hypothetical protein